MIFSINAEKNILHNPTTVIIKTLNKLVKKGMCFKIIKAMHDNPTTKISLSSEKLKAFFPRLETEKCRYPFLAFIFNTTLDVLAREIGQER